MPTKESKVVDDLMNYLHRYGLVGISYISNQLQVINNQLD